MDWMSLNDFRVTVSTQKREGDKIMLRFVAYNQIRGESLYTEVIIKNDNPALVALRNLARRMEP